jgi:hypothetical protein
VGTLPLCLISLALQDFYSISCSTLDITSTSNHHHMVWPSFRIWIRNDPESNYRNPREREPLPENQGSHHLLPTRLSTALDYGPSLSDSRCHIITSGQDPAKPLPCSSNDPPLGVPSSLILAAPIPARPWAQQCTSSLLVVCLPNPIDPVIRSKQRQSGGQCQNRVRFQVTR